MVVISRSTLPADYPAALTSLLEKWGRLPPGAAAGALASAALAGRPLEPFLIGQLGVPRGEIVRAIGELKEAYCFALGAEWIESNLQRRFPEELAQRLGVYPLAFYGNRLFVLLEPGDDEARVLARGPLPGNLALVPLGAIEGVEGRLAALYGALHRLESDSRSLGQYLVSQGLISTDELDRALQGQRQRGGQLGQVLIQARAITETTLHEALAAYRNQPYYPTGRLLEMASVAVVKKLPQAFAERNHVLALKVEGDTPWAASANPENMEVLDAAAKAFGCARIHVGVAAPSAIQSVIHALYAEEGGLDFQMLGAAEAQSDPAQADHGGVNLPEVPRIVSHLLFDAVRSRASDIHLERYKDRVEIRYRIDGALVRIEDSPITIQNVQWIIAKVKVEAKMDIAERRRPQDGAIRGRIGNRSVDFRIAVQPTIWGENVVIRILDQSAGVPELGDLGLADDTLAQLRRLLQNPQGLCLLTGPTGCGKTTTLYAVLQELKGTGVKIVTAEDPVEYAIDGVQQSQIQETTGNTFDRYLRAFMRQDPDVILVGEVRDSETAEMAVRAALTGHLIFSTLHVSDAIGTARRLSDLGVDRNLIAQTLLCVVSQRLARRVCARCEEGYWPEPKLLAEFFPEGIPGRARFRRGRGCPACHQTGYAGRLALVEFWEPDDEARELIDRGADAHVLRSRAVEAGMRPLVLDALGKAQEGLTTLEELRSVLPYEQIKRYCWNRPAAAPAQGEGGAPVEILAEDLLARVSGPVSVTGLG